MIARRLLYVACALVALFALYRIVHADDGIVRTSANVDGIPVEIFAPAPEPNARLLRVYPAVVIAHGYAGSKQVMYELARNAVVFGTVAVVFDFSGHGANQTPLDVNLRANQLDNDLARVLRFARMLHNVDESRVALLGHSMGAGVVVRYARQHPDITAVIAISGNSPDVTPSSPNNLLLMAGALEFDSIKNAQNAALSNAGGLRKAKSNWASHLARELHIVPGVEHLTILWSPDAQDATTEWLRNTYADPTTIGESGEMRDRIVRVAPLVPPPWRQLLINTPAISAALLFSLAVFVLFFPLSSFAVSRLGLRAAAPPVAGLPYWQVLLVAVVPAVLAPLILRGLSLTPLDPAMWLPIQIVNYLAMHFLLYAALMLGMLRLLGVRDMWGRIRASARPAAFLLAVLFLAWIYLTNGVVAHLTWMNFLPSGVTRLWLWPVVGLLALPYFVLNEYVTKAATARQSAFNEVTAKAALTGSLLFAVAITPGLFFLLLVIAVFAVFFTVYGAYAVQLHRLTGNPLIAALGYAAMTAALLVAVFPITR